MIVIQSEEEWTALLHLLIINSFVTFTITEISSNILAHIIRNNKTEYYVMLCSLAEVHWSSSEISVNFYQNTWYHNLDNASPYSHKNIILKKK
jgi:hypothetical protein